MAGGTRAVVRREEPHPGAQLSPARPRGMAPPGPHHRSADADISYLEGPPPGPFPQSRTHIRNAKDTGLRNLPFAGSACSGAWVELVLMAQDLLALTKGLVLGGELATAEPRRLRYMILAGRTTVAPARSPCTSSTTGAGRPSWPPPSPAFRHSRCSAEPITLARSRTLARASARTRHSGPSSRNQAISEAPSAMFMGLTSLKPAVAGPRSAIEAAQPSGPSC